MIRRAETDADFSFCARVKNAVQPREPVTADELRDDPSARLLLVDGAGYAVVKPSSLAGLAFAMPRVLPEARRRGVGSALLASCEDEARTLGLHGLWSRVEGDDPEALAFAMHRGFVEIGREVEQTRVLGDEPPPEPPEGIELVQGTDEHLASIYAVAVEVTPGMALDAEIAAPPYELWLAETRGRVFQVALEAGRVVGYATLAPLAALPDTLEHEMTGVLPSHRRRGIAEALKRAQIDWASRAGYRRLVTYTQVGNVAMRSLNAKLGYEERTGTIALRGPLL
jgi:mycothiol synthase